MSHKIEVDADALKQVLEAFVSNQPHRVLELQAIMTLEAADFNPVGLLVRDYNEHYGRSYRIG